MTVGIIPWSLLPHDLVLVGTSTARHRGRLISVSPGAPFVDSGKHSSSLRRVSVSTVLDQRRAYQMADTIKPPPSLGSQGMSWVSWLDLSRHQ